MYSGGPQRETRTEIMDEWEGYIYEMLVYAGE